MKNNRITRTLGRAARNRRKLFCAFLTLGYPNLAFTKRLIKEMETAGVDLVELGFPFSDPLADGPVIQKASEHALRKKVSLNDAFRLARELRKEGCGIPLIFFSYYNPILHHGPKRFASDLRKNGFDGIICPDLPPDEDMFFAAAVKKQGLHNIYLTAPTTEPGRLKMIASKSSGFVYYVSLKGVTGMRKALSSDLKAQIARIKKVTSKPVLIGFGISTPAHAAKACAVSDGVIVGSAIVNKIEQAHGKLPEVTRFIRLMADTVKKAGPRP